MTGLDTNILVQLAFAEHPAHEITVTALRKEASSGSRLVFPSLVITEFLHIATHSKRLAPPMAMAEAVDWINGLLQNPLVTLLDSGTASVNQTLLWMQQFGLGRKRIIDTHLAAILHTSGATRLMTSNPSDFAIFGVFEIIVPAATSSPGGTEGPGTAAQ